MAEGQRSDERVSCPGGRHPGWRPPGHDSRSSDDTRREEDGWLVKPRPHQAEQACVHFLFIPAIQEYLRGA